MLPVRVAVIGNHIPRQCGIVIFTTDLCDAIAVEYGAASVLVVAVNDLQSRYSYPARVRFQISGTLTYALDAGKAIISTPHWHATKLLDHRRGALVPFEDPAAIADIAIEFLDNDAARLAMRKRGYLYARRMFWSRVAQPYMRAFQRVRADRMQPACVGFPLRAAKNNVTSRLLTA
jgi:hypothetical protein